MPVRPLLPAHTVFFLCDIQSKFRPAVHGYEQVIATANKLIRLAKLLDINVLATTQNTRALGPIDPAIDLPALGGLLIANLDKSLFSMLTADVKAVLDARPTVDSIVLFGIESHVCVLQTVLALLGLERYRVYVVADGISSCNAFEVPIAIERMRQEGAAIGTSESIAFQLMNDAALPQFKAFSSLIKEDKESTKIVGQVLLLGLSPADGQANNEETEITSGGVMLKSGL